MFYSPPPTLSLRTYNPSLIEDISISTVLEEEFTTPSTWNDLPWLLKRLISEVVALPSSITSFILNGIWIEFKFDVFFGLNFLSIGGYPGTCVFHIQTKLNLLQRKVIADNCYRLLIRFQTNSLPSKQHIKSAYSRHKIIQVVLQKAWPPLRKIVGSPGNKYRRWVVVLIFEMSQVIKTWWRGNNFNTAKAWLYYRLHGWALGVYK